MTEIWKPVPSWPGYSASSLGRIRRDVPRGKFKNPRIMRGSYYTEGYVAFQTTVEGRRVTVGYHVMVCEAFHGPKPEWATLVRHLDDDGLNNVPDNLAWGTGAMNAEDARRMGTLCIGEQHGNAKLTEADVLEIFAMRASGCTGKQIGLKYSINRNTVNKILARKLWGHVVVAGDLLNQARAATEQNIASARFI